MKVTKAQLRREKMQVFNGQVRAEVCPVAHGKDAKNVFGGIVFVVDVLPGGAHMFGRSRDSSRFLWLPICQQRDYATDEVCYR